METAIKHTWGGRRPGAGRKKTPTTQLRDAIDAIDIPSCIKRLEEWAKGKPVICPHCKRDTGCYTADTVALQAAVELLNRKLGKPKQVTDLNINVDIVQIATVYRNVLIEAEGEYKQLTEGVIEGEVKDV